MRSRESFSGRTYPASRASASSRKRALFASSASVDRFLIAEASRSSKAPRSTASSASAPASALELDDLLCAPPALDERRAHEEEDAERAHEETDEKGCDDHRVDA